MSSALANEILNVFCLDLPSDWKDIINEHFAGFCGSLLVGDLPYSQRYLSNLATFNPVAERFLSRKLWAVDDFSQFGSVERGYCFITCPVSAREGVLFRHFAKIIRFMFIRLRASLLEFTTFCEFDFDIVSRWMDRKTNWKQAIDVCSDLIRNPSSHSMLPLAIVFPMDYTVGDFFVDVIACYIAAREEELENATIENKENLYFFNTFMNQ